MQTSRPTVLVALLTALVLELVRSSGPLLDMAFSRGVVSAAGAAVATYAAPGLIAPLLVLAGRRVLAGRVLGRPVLAGPVLTVAVLTGVALLAVARLVVQALSAGARFGVGLATVAIGIAVLVLAVDAFAARSGGPAAARAVSLGLAGAVGLQLVLATWDAYWRHDVVGWTVTIALVGTTAAVAWSSRGDLTRPDMVHTDDDAPAPDAGRAGRAGPSGRLWALGPLLGLAAMVLANPAFAASQTSVPLAVAGAAVGLGWVLAAVMTGGNRVDRVPAPAAFGWLAAAAGVVLMAGLMVADGWTGLVMVVAAPPVAALALGGALAPKGAGTRAGAPRNIDARAEVPQAGRAALSAALVGLGTILPLLVYQLDYDVPLGIPNGLVLVVAAAALGMAGVRRTAVSADAEPAGEGAAEAAPSSPGGAPSSVWAPASEPASASAPASPSAPPASRTTLRWRPGPMTAAAALLALGVGLAGARAVDSHRASELTPDMDLSDQVTLVSWNLHYGVDPTGDVDLEQIARTIEAQHPSVVTLQEVSRGWVMGGGADVATWLADRLDMRMSFAPAADRQFGNVILTSLPHDAVEVLELPYGAGPQERSALSVDVLVAGGPLRVTSVHLQHRAENTPTRLDQIAALLAAEGDAPVSIVAGDINAEPGWPEIALLTDDAGYVSAVDVAGDPAALTSPSIDPWQRIDWVFGHGVTFVQARVLTDALSSDHLPIVVELRTGDPVPLD